jgi:hypothetical protein
VARERRLPGASAGYRAIDNYTHVEGRTHRTAIAHVEVRVGR